MKINLINSIDKIDIDTLRLDTEQVIRNIFAKKIANEIVQDLELKELPDYNPHIKMITSEIHILQPSQYEKIIQILRSMRGFNPQIDLTTQKIKDELEYVFREI